MTKAGRPTALATLLMACALLSAGFVSHDHDDGHADRDGHHCAVCCLQHHFSAATTTAPAPAAPDLAALAAAASCRRCGCDRRALHPDDPRTARVTPPPVRRRLGRSTGIDRDADYPNRGNRLELARRARARRPWEEMFMRIRRHAAAAALALSAAATAGPLAPSPAFAFEEAGSIQGIVVAEDGGAPLPAALVVLDGSGLSATTGADGAFAIDGVTAGAYRLTVTREAFAELALPVTVVAGQPVLLDLRLAVLQFEESVVVTATQTERAVTEVAASVTILDAETIEASSARNLQDLLRRTPGFDLAETSGMAARANSSLVMRGVPGTKRALLLVDGLPANDLGHGSLAGLSLVPLESLERAEVVRGPFSSLYGANAFSGAINAITRPGAGPPAADFFASGGSAGYYQLGTSVRGESGPVAYSLTADRRKVDNVYNRDTRTVPAIGGDGSLGSREVPLRNVGYEDVRMMGRLDFAVSDAWRVTLLPRISRYETGLDLSSRLPAAVEEHKRDTAFNLGGILRYAGTGALSAQIRTSYRYSTQRLFQENFTLAPTRLTTIVDPPGPAVVESVTRGVFPFAALTGQDTDFYSALVEPQLTWAPNLDHTVVFGASYTREHGAFGDSTIADRSNLLGSDATLARIAAGIQAGMAAGGVPNPTVTLVRDPAIGAAFPLSHGPTGAVRHLRGVRAGRVGAGRRAAGWSPACATTTTRCSDRSARRRCRCCTP